MKTCLLVASNSYLNYTDSPTIQQNLNCNKMSWMPGMSTVYHLCINIHLDFNLSHIIHTVIVIFSVYLSNTS